jgi:hypothetical protein
MRIGLQSLQTLLEHNGLRSDHSSSGELFLLELIEDLTALLYILVGEEGGTVALEVLGYLITVRFVGVLLSIAERHSNYLVFTHQELGIGKSLSERLEVIGAHVLIGEDVEVLILGEEAVHPLDDELLVLAQFWLHTSKRDHLVSLGFRHQQ